MSAKHLLRAAFAGAVLLGACLFVAKPTKGQPLDTATEQLTIRAVDRSDPSIRKSRAEACETVYKGGRSAALEARV